VHQLIKKILSRPPPRPGRDKEKEGRGKGEDKVLGGDEGGL
jgi:hypothetical protein